MATSIEQNPHFDIGNRGLLIFMGQRFVTSVLDATDNELRVSYPVSEFPQEGMCINLEFQDDGGYTSYESEVLEAARQPGDGLLLKRPLDAVRGHHRNWWRIPADFRVEVKDHVHPRKHEAAVIDISGGGMLIHCDNGYDAGDNVDLHFALPGDSKAHYALGQVVHTSPVDLGREHGEHVGLRFIDLDPDTGQCLSRYVWRRLRELHTAS